AVDEHVELLANEYRVLASFDCVQHLENTRIDALRVVAGERLLGHDVRLDAHEAHGHLVSRVTARIGLSRCAAAEAWDVPFIDINANVMSADVAQDHEGFHVLFTDTLTGSDIDLEYDAVHRRHHGRPGDLGLRLFNLGARFRHHGLGDINVRL